MSESEFSLPDIHYVSPNLDTPEPPADLSYADIADFYNRELLLANGIQISEESLLSALASQSGILLAAAAHTAGSASCRRAAPLLTRLLSSPDDQVKAESGFALARLGQPEGKSALGECLRLDPEIHLGPCLAAGFLAQLDCADGLPVIAAALSSTSRTPRMLACKQLYYFARFQGRRDDSGHEMDVAGLFRMALRDPETDVQWQALAQLAELDALAFAALLEDYARDGQDEGLRGYAVRIVEARSAG